MPISLARPTPTATETPTPVPAPPPTTDLRDNPNYRELHVLAAHATLYTGTLGIHAPNNQWTGLSDQRATALIDGIRLIYTRHPAQRLGAHAICRHGNWHDTTPTDQNDLDAFRDQVAACTDHDRRAQRAAHLGVSLRRATTAAEETQALDVRELRDQHTPDNEHPQEHPA
ncbi:hypothetical protein [Streptomyces sp. NEAU-H3]|uniref:hypothetical protein n=1 Tax=Streptomyces sp. NEAU-H3 TaxID=2720636 RepID=UPI001439D29E|nr:hypothetical protein [Streptomyces sp. NEAU-H3]NJA56704.1 hypothetical protein [Streptomyces sp. NEAU-H3]